MGKKIYITGGIGARHEGEAFGDNYELPNLTAYNETCAAIGNVYTNYRLFLLHGDAKYFDVLERTLYNGLIPVFRWTADGSSIPIRWLATGSTVSMPTTRLRASRGSVAPAAPATSAASSLRCRAMSMR